MVPDPVIQSILIRYEKKLPVSIEEKAVLHKWLGEAVKFSYAWKCLVRPPAQFLSFSNQENITTEINITENRRSSIIADRINPTDKLHSPGSPIVKEVGTKRRVIHFFRNFTSVFFRIFALCLPTKK